MASSKQKISYNLRAPCSLFSCSIVSNSLWPHELHHNRFLCFHYLPEFSQTIDLVMPSNYLILCCPFFSFPQSFLASGSFPMSWFFASGSQSIGALASASVLPMNIQGWVPLRFNWFDLLVQETLESLRQHHGSKSSILWCSVFFMVQLSHPYMTTGRTIALTIWTFVGKAKVLFLIHCLGLS